MEAQASGDVELEIGVVHPVQPPQHRHGMEQCVLEVDARSSRITDAAIASQAGASSARKSPQPRASASSAVPTAAVGNTSRTTPVLRATMPRLLGQRRPRPIS